MILIDNIDDYSKQDHWFDINWYQTERIVKRLQARIVKASREGKIKNPEIRKKEKTAIGCR